MRGHQPHTRFRNDLLGMFVFRAQQAFSGLWQRSNLGRWNRPSTVKNSKKECRWIKKRLKKYLSKTLPTPSCRASLEKHCRRKKAWLWSLKTSWMLKKQGGMKWTHNFQIKWNNSKRNKKLSKPLVRRTWKWKSQKASASKMRKL